MLGVVVGAHGLRGEVRVKYFGDGPDGLSRMPTVEFASGLDDPEPRRCRLLRVGRGRRGEARVALEGIDDRDGADALRGRQVIGEARHLEPLAEGEYRWYQLVGCEVFALATDPANPAGERIGTVVEIWDTGGHDTLVVESEEGQRHLLPAAEAFVREVDPARRRIVYEVIPGLIGDPL